jgi:hypothetical protein
VVRGTVRSWLSRGRRPIVRQPRSPAELDALAAHIDGGLAAVREAIDADDPGAILAAASTYGRLVDAMLLADGGPVPPEVAARITRDPWSGEPVQRATFTTWPTGQGGKWEAGMRRFGDLLDRHCQEREYSDQYAARLWDSWLTDRRPPGPASRLDRWERRGRWLL